MHGLEHLQRRTLGVAIAAAQVAAVRLGDLLADGHHRVERVFRVLQHHGDALAAQLAKAAFGQAAQVRIAQPQFVRLDTAWVADKAHDGAPGRGFARTAFAHDAQALAAQSEAHVAHRADIAVVAGIGDAEVVHGKQGVRHDLASPASRSPSPSRLKPRLTMKMASPGMVATHHWSSSTCRPEETIAPHSGAGGCAPRPRKPSPAAVRMMPAMSRVSRMITLGRQSGTIWVAMMRSGEAPCSSTAWMYSARRLVNVSARARRA